MKHFQDEDYDAMKDYEFSLMHHEDDKNQNEDYDKPMFHYDEDDWIERDSTIRHFQDD